MVDGVENRLQFHPFPLCSTISVDVRHLSHKSNVKYTTQADEKPIFVTLKGIACVHLVLCSTFSSVPCLWSFLPSLFWTGGTTRSICKEVMHLRRTNVAGAAAAGARFSDLHVACDQFVCLSATRQHMQGCTRNFVSQVDPNQQPLLLQVPPLFGQQVDGVVRRTATETCTWTVIETSLETSPSSCLFLVGNRTVLVVAFGMNKSQICTCLACSGVHFWGGERLCG